MMTARRPFPILAALVLLLLALVIAPASAQSPQRAKVAASSTAILIWLAKDLGYLDNVPVDVERMASGIATGQAVVDGTAQLATSSDFAFTARVLEHDHLRLLATMSSSQTAKLIARAAAVGEEPVDLKELRYAVTRNAVSHFFLSDYLALHGLEIADVDVVFLPATEIVVAMEEGSVDAALVWEPYVSRIASSLSGEVIYFEDQLDQFYYFCLYGSGDWIENNLQTVAGFLAALKQAEQYAQARPDESTDRLSRFLDIEREVLARIWRSHTLRVLIPQDLPSILEAHTEWRMTEGLVGSEQIPNVLEFLDMRPLQAVWPASVHVLN